jgi:NADPH-dependent curcumin reductase CurA
MGEMNLRVVLASRPAQQGWLTEENFRLEAAEIPSPAAGEVLVRNHWLSLDPYMRGRMNAARSYAPPQPLGEVMLGGTAGEVVASRHPDFAVGDAVVGRLGWQHYALSNGEGLRRVDVRQAPLSVWLGVLGMPGVTAWIGLFDICQPQPGETVVVTAAAGAVGSVVGQLARLHGCRVVGIAGGTEKCRHVVDELGFDACIDYKAAALWPALKEATPDRIDCLFENVGGEIFDTLLGRMNAHARIALCGMVAQYNSAPVPIHNLSSLLVNRIRLQGFIVTELMSRWPVALAALGEHYAAGRLHYRETIVDGLNQAPAALIGLLQGRNLGKQLVRLVDI